MGVGNLVGVGNGVGVFVGSGVGVGSSVGVGIGVTVGTGLGVGIGVIVGSGEGVGMGVAVGISATRLLTMASTVASISGVGVGREVGIGVVVDTVPAHAKPIAATTVMRLVNTRRPKFTSGVDTHFTRHVREGRLSTIGKQPIETGRSEMPC